MSDFVQNITITCLCVVVLISSFNNRRLSKEIIELQKQVNQRQIIIKNDYEKNIAYKFDSLNMVIDTMPIDSVYTSLTRYLEKEYEDGVFFYTKPDTNFIQDY